VFGLERFRISEIRISEVLLYIVLELAKTIYFQLLKKLHSNSNSEVQNLIPSYTLPNIYSHL